MELGLWGLGCTVYPPGVECGLCRTDARLAARVGLALLWPLGPFAFASTISVLLVVSLIASPVFGAAVLLAAAGAWRALLST